MALSYSFSSHLPKQKDGQKNMADIPKQGQSMEKKMYIKRGEEEDQRGRASYIIFCISYLSYVILSKEG